jgi:hypothetical protein
MHGSVAALLVQCSVVVLHGTSQSCSVAGACDVAAAGLM